MNSGFSIFKQFANAGSTVRLLIAFIKDTPVEGKIIAIADDGVLIDTGSARAYYRAEDIVSYELLEIVTTDTSKPSLLPLSQAATNHTLVSPSENFAPSTATRFENMPLPEELAEFDEEPFLAVPVPDFKEISLDVPEDIHEIIRFKNVFDYAEKVREPERTVATLAPLVRLAERTGNSRLHKLCGILAARVGSFALATKELALADSNDVDVRLAKASVAIQQHEFRRAAEELQLAITTEKFDEEQFRAICHALGCLVHRLGNTQLPGLARLVCSAPRPDSMRLAERVLARSLWARAPTSASAVLSQDIVGARNIEPTAPEFLQFVPPIIVAVDPQADVAPPPLAQRSGRITAIYVDLGYLTDEQTNQTFFFRRTEVEPESLRTRLRKGRVGQQVTFVPVLGQQVNGRYALAQQVTLDPSAVDSVSQAEKVRMDKEVSPYFRAKKAEQLQSFAQAEEFFREEITKRGERFQSAVKDLAWMYNRLQRFEEALAVLDEHRESIENLRAVDNLRLQTLTRLERFEEALEVAQRLAETGSTQARSALRKQIALLLFRTGRYDEALTLLKQVLHDFPSDYGLQQLIEKIAAAKATGGTVDGAWTAEDFRELAEWSSGLSDFSRYLLDTCDYALVDERSKARGYFDRDDFNALDNISEKIRGRRPGEKAKVLLTLAKMCLEYPDAAGDRELSDYLSRALTFLGEAALSPGGQRTHPDTARCYLAEALSLTNRNTTLALVPLLGSYLTLPPTPGALTDQDGNRILKPVLQLLEADQSAWRKVQRDFIYYSVMSSAATELLQRELSKGFPKLTHFLASRTILEKSRDQEMERLRNERNVLLSLEQADYIGAGNLADAVQKISELAEKTRFETDRNRLKTLGNILQDASRFWSEQDYVERETRYRELQEGIRTFVKSIEEGRTKLSVETLLPLARRLSDASKADFDDYIARTNPVLALRNILSGDYYVPDSAGEMTVRLELTSKPGGAPVEGLELTAEDTDGLQVLESCKSPERLRPGDRRELELRILPSPEQLRDKAFTLRALLTFRSRSSEIIACPQFAIPIRIGRREEFATIPNPYQNYSGGKSVDDPNMFKGREDLLKRIAEVVTKGPEGQCFVLYGQKRSGKTSVLRQLRRRIERPAVAFEVTIGALDVSTQQTNFGQLCADRIYEEITGGQFAAFDVSWWPSDADLRTSPMDTLRKILIRVRAELKRQFGRKARIVMLIDEFTYLYEYITEGLLSSTFMRTWKSLLEMELFSAVVVGQDSMPKFKQAFPNEFGVTHDERISYLSEVEATRLAEEPILFNGQSRYRGYAMQRLIELTAGSPFYIQILCDRIVRQLNEKSAPFITEADVEIIGRQLTSGGDALPIERFDPLITAAGESVAEASRESYLELLTSIARQSGRYGARISELAVLTNRDKLLTDMQDREVISRDAEGRVAIRVGLFADWLRSHSVRA